MGRPKSWKRELYEREFLRPPETICCLTCFRPIENPRYDLKSRQYQKFCCEQCDPSRRAWSEYEDLLLVYGYRRGESLVEMMQRLQHTSSNGVVTGRSLSSTWNRLQVLIEQGTLEKRKRVSAKRKLREIHWGHVKAVS